MKYALEIKNLTFKYNNKILFKNFNLNIVPNSNITFYSENNAGKSTLASIIKGNIIVDNILVFGKKPTKNKKEVFIIDINYNKYFKTKTIDETIEKEINKHNIYVKDVSNKINTFLKAFNINRKKQVKHLNSNEKIIIVILLALLTNTKLLIIDNILEYLDYIEKDKILKILNKFNEKESLTILNLTTNIEEALYAKELIIYKNKKIIIKGKVKEVFKEIELLEQNKIELPFIISLSNKLMFYNLIDKIYYNKEQLVNAIWK